MGDPCGRGRYPDVRPRRTPPSDVRRLARAQAPDIDSRHRCPDEPPRAGRRAPRWTARAPTCWCAARASPGWRWRAHWRVRAPTCWSSTATRSASGRPPPAPRRRPGCGRSGCSGRCARSCRRWASAPRSACTATSCPGRGRRSTTASCACELWETCGAARFETATVQRRTARGVQTDRGELVAPLVVDALGWRRVLGAGLQPPGAPLSRGLEVHPHAPGGDSLDVWVDRDLVRAGYAWRVPAGGEQRVGVGSYRPRDHVKEPVRAARRPARHAGRALAGQLVPAPPAPGRRRAHVLRRRRRGPLPAAVGRGHPHRPALRPRPAAPSCVPCVEGRRTRAAALRRYAAASRRLAPHVRAAARRPARPAARAAARARPRVRASCRTRPPSGVRSRGTWTRPRRRPCRCPPCPAPPRPGASPHDLPPGHPRRPRLRVLPDRRRGRRRRGRRRPQARRSTSTCTSRATWACASSTSSRRTTTPTTSPGTAAWPPPPARRSTSTALAAPDYEHEPFDDGWELELGDAARARPAHARATGPSTRRSRSSTRAAATEPWAVLTGDSLFVGDIARPDLAVDKAEGARGIFRSLHERLLPLPDDVRGLARPPRRLAVRRPRDGHEGLLDDRLRARAQRAAGHRRRGRVRATRRRRRSARSRRTSRRSSRSTAGRCARARRRRIR